MLTTTKWYPRIHAAAPVGPMFMWQLGFAACGEYVTARGPSAAAAAGAANRPAAAATTHRKPVENRRLTVARPFVTASMEFARHASSRGPLAG